VGPARTRSGGKRAAEKKEAFTKAEQSAQGWPGANRYDSRKCMRDHREGPSRKKGGGSNSQGRFGAGRDVKKRRGKEERNIDLTWEVKTTNKCC